MSLNQRVEMEVLLELAGRRTTPVRALLVDPSPCERVVRPVSSSDKAGYVARGHAGLQLG